jgi:hypothetical protein
VLQPFDTTPTLMARETNVSRTIDSMSGDKSPSLRSFELSDKARRHRPIVGSFAACCARAASGVTLRSIREETHEDAQQTILASILLITSATALASAQQASPVPPTTPYGPPIGLEAAKKVMAAAEADAIKNNWGMAIAILDSTATW